MIKIDAVGVISSNIKQTIKFYEILGFVFPDISGDEQHIEAISKKGEVRLMIDSKEFFIKETGLDLKVGSASAFALLCENVDLVDSIAKSIGNNGFKILKEPWNAFWGQRYCIVEDPDGYKIDLFANITQ